MSFSVRFTPAAKADIERMYGFLAEHDPAVAKRALAVLGRTWSILEEFPFSCRKAEAENSFLREIVIPFGGAGYVALFEIEDQKTVTVLAIRHQRENDYYC